MIKDGDREQKTYCFWVVTMGDDVQLKDFGVNKEREGYKSLNTNEGRECFTLRSKKY